MRPEEHEQRAFAVAEIAARPAGEIELVRRAGRCREEDLQLVLDPCRPQHLLEERVADARPRREEVTERQRFLGIADGAFV